MDKDTAVRVTRHVEAMIDQANEVLHLVNNSCPQDERGRFQQVLGTAVAEIDLELLEPIYKQFPDLRPDGMEEIKSV
jgi:hypothetical protein